jgi:hypothetical protein
MAMCRVQWIEIEDKPWCPKDIRDGATDYLQFVVAKAQPYQAMAEQLGAALDQAGAERVIDLCDGAGGPWPTFQPLLSAARKQPV